MIMTNEDDDPTRAQGDLLDFVLARIAGEWQPLLVVAITRLASERYRTWATSPDGERYRSRLLACANRQDEIARAIEALYDDAGEIESEIVSRNPDLADIDRVAFAGRPLPEQFLIQARWSRLSAAAWRAFAQEEDDAARNLAFCACAELEEMNALVLEATISAPLS